MNETLNAPFPLEENQDIRGPYDTETPRFPLLVAARIAIEWARLSADAGIRGWGSQYWGQPLTIGVDRWIVGYQNNAYPVIIVTVNGNEYGGGAKYQRNFEIDPKNLLDGVELAIERSW